MKTRKIMAAALAVITAVGTAAAVSAKGFTDMNPSHWAYGYIDALADRGIINGYEDGSFRADAHITRAQWATMLTTAADLPARHVGLALDCCADMTPKYWAAQAMVAANKYLTPYWDESIEGWWYYPENDATREDVVLSLAKYKEYVTDNTSALNDFADAASITDEAKPYVAAAVENGLVSGFDDGTLRLSSPVTRAEASVFICRAFGVEPTAQPTVQYSELSMLPYYGDTQKCVMSLQMAAAYADVLDSLPKTFSQYGNTYDLKACLADPAGDGMPLLITAYALDNEYVKGIALDDNGTMVDIWTWDGEKASAYPYRDKTVCGNIAELYFDGSDIVITHGSISTIDSVGTVIYTVSNANLTLKHESMSCYAYSGDGVTASSIAIVFSDGRVIKSSGNGPAKASVSDLLADGWQLENGFYTSRTADGKRLSSNETVSWLPMNIDYTNQIFGCTAGELELSADNVYWADAADVAARLRR